MSKKTPLPAKGRRTENRQWEKDTHYRDTLAPESTEMGMLQKQDEIIAAMKALAAKLDADTGVTDTDYADTLTIDQLKLM